MNITGVNSNSQFFSTIPGVREKDYTTARQDGISAAAGQTGDSFVPEGQLDEKQKKEVEALQKIDEHVKQHEAAHQAAAGALFRGKSFSYKVGPDGKRYAVAGEVQIDTSPINGNPAATKAKMERVKRAATAPSDPSPQDLKVAETASRAESEAAEEEAAEKDAVNATFIAGQKGAPNNSASGTAQKNKRGTIKVSATGLHIANLYARQLKTDETRRINVSY